MKAFGAPALLRSFQRLSLCGSSPLQRLEALASRSPAPVTLRVRHHGRQFSTTQPSLGNWLEPSFDRKKKMSKGRPRVPTGGSSKGTTVIWGDYGLRMASHDQRISAKQLKLAEDTIKLRLRGEKYRLYKRKCCNVGVYVSGNEMRMGKGKGSFDHWAARMAVSQVLFEIRGLLHEQVVRDAFRLAGQKLPGQWEFITKSDPPVVGITKLDGVTLEELKRPRRMLRPLERLQPATATPTTETKENAASTSPNTDL